MRPPPPPTHTHTHTHTPRHQRTQIVRRSETKLWQPRGNHPNRCVVFTVVDGCYNEALLKGRVQDKVELVGEGGAYHTVEYISDGLDIHRTLSTTLRRRCQEHHRRKPQNNLMMCRCIDRVGGSVRVLRGGEGVD
jgi:hypothetical protein